MTQEINRLIGRAIREGKYLEISYKNTKGEIKHFWISVLDIEKNGKLVVNMFNVAHEEPILAKKISISQIQSAEILKFSTYEVPESLLKKLIEDDNLEIYAAERYESNLLNYYLECYRANRDPFLYKTHLIPGVDIEELSGQEYYTLSDAQKIQIIEQIYHSDYSKYDDYDLVVSDFSIDIKSKGLFVVAYRKLTFDPVLRTLKIDRKTHFNANFYIKNVKHSLSYYCDISPKDFEEIYNKNKTDALQLLQDNFKTGELLNTRPEIAVLGYSQIDIHAIYDNIQSESKSQKLELPLKALFQKYSLNDRTNRKEPIVVAYDQNINIDQIRTVYNALKQPITYIQGPPGTGKTQTILNILVNCLTNDKTLLISSNNNVPIDGIKNKIHLGKFNGQEIILPIIRLGNNQHTEAALNTIKELYSLESENNPTVKAITQLKKQIKSKSEKLTIALKQYEDQIENEQKLKFLQELMKKGRNHLLENETKIMEEKVKSIIPVADDNISEFYEVIENNTEFLEFFHLVSMQYLNRLKSKDFTELIDIVLDEDHSKKVSKFNTWIGKDSNLEKFTKVFPIILTTNLSCRKLGTKYKFDLLVMDEAGQCDIPTSLISISKCRNMVLIGDTNQLKPIVVVEEKVHKNLKTQFGINDEYDFYKNSILSMYKQIDTISTDILLRFHYRCGEKIINFSNKRYYGSKLDISKIKKPGKVKLIDVNNVNQKDKNSNIEEAREIVQFISDYKLSDVFIITPFRNQESVLNHYLKEAQQIGKVKASVSCGTIHKIQGQENKTIIISTSISKATTPKTYDWIKNNSELINVGVTRAKENLVVVTDSKAVDILSRKDDDLYALIEYIHNNGTTTISESKFNKLSIGFSNHSKFEDEFYKTMSHYCSVKGTKYVRNVKVTTVFPDQFHNAELNKKEFDGVIYENGIAKVVFELNGPEHYNNKKRIESDKIKMDLLKSSGIRLITIPNKYAKHYQFIRELINKINGDAYQTSFFE